MTSIYETLLVCPQQQKGKKQTNMDPPIRTKQRTNSGDTGMPDLSHLGPTDALDRGDDRGCLVVGPDPAPDLRVAAGRAKPQPAIQANSFGVPPLCFEVTFLSRVRHF